VRHVFVESNWIFEFCSPRHRQGEQALELLRRATTTELVLHVPAICLREGAETVRRKCQPKYADLKEYRRWARANGRLNDVDFDAVGRFFASYQTDVISDLSTLDIRLEDLATNPKVDVFPLSDATPATSFALPVARHRTSGDG
jgi:hypothetical protein